MNQFIRRFSSKIMATLCGFDRIRFRGTLRSLAYARGMSGFLYELGVRFTEYRDYACGISSRIREALEQMARQAERPVIYLNDQSHDKEKVVQEVLAENPVEKGLIALLKAKEMGPSYEVQSVGDGDARRLVLMPRLRPCLHCYYYFLDPQVGLGFVRLQTYFPFTLHLYMNGRAWLAQQLDRAGIAYVRCDNCFTHIDDWAAAQDLANQQLHTDWQALLDPFAALVHPLWHDLFGDKPLDYYWSADESEWASDIVFRRSDELMQLYPRLTRHGIDTLGCSDVLRFFGRQHPERCQPGKVRVRQRRDEQGNARLRFHYGHNSCKFYLKGEELPDAGPVVLRPETTVNDPKMFEAYRTKEGDDDGAKGWRPLRKGVADLHRRAQVSQAVNDRMLDALAAVEESTPLGQVTEPVCRPAKWRGRRVRALNPLSDADARLFTAVNRGDFAINGFRNQDIRALLFANQGVSKDEQRRQSAAVTRQMRLLRGHGIIRKVRGKHRYHLTPKGQKVITAILTARQADTTKLAQVA